MQKGKLLEAVFGRETGYEPPDEVVAEVLGELTARERFVLERRFALVVKARSTFGGMTLEAIGQIIGVTHERVRQVEAKALRKLRHPDKSKRLWPEPMSDPRENRRRTEWGLEGS